jgi:flagellar biosynthesis anti-sigma factor FlgM
VTQSDGVSGAAASASGSAPVQPTTASGAPGDAETTDAEAVTVSSDASTSTELLASARSADGINQSVVSALRSAVQNGTYNVSPEDLARSITSALREIAA